MEDKTMGSRIKELRDSLGWSQEKLAAETGTSKSYISYVEKNQREPGAENLKKIATVLGTTMDYLATGKNTLVDLEDLEPELKEIYEELSLQGNLPIYRRSGQFDREGLKSILQFIRYIKQESLKSDKK